jgi:hypothetical protein
MKQQISVRGGWRPGGSKGVRVDGKRGDYRNYNGIKKMTSQLMPFPGQDKVKRQNVQ